MKKNFVLFVTFIFIILSCQNPSNKTSEANNTNTQTNPQQVVSELLQFDTFHLQLVSNGILHPTQKAELRFLSGGILKEIKVSNGDKVNKGSIVARLENEKEKIAVAKAKEQISAAKIELNSMLISFGGKQNDSTSIEPALYQNLKIKSGYYKAINQLEKAQLDFNNTILKAPYSGIVADLQVQVFDYISSSEVFCKLFDNSSFIAEFSVLESEISKIHKGQAIIIIPYANDSLQLTANITQINPIVDDNGLINIQAQTATDKSSSNMSLFDGMNIKVVIVTQVLNQLIIPKDALVLRSNKQVVFTYENGLAKWNYVTIAYENSTHYAIQDGLKENDTVIVKGNLNLAHDAKVEIETVIHNK